MLGIANGNPPTADQEGATVKMMEIQPENTDLATLETNQELMNVNNTNA